MKKKPNSRGAQKGTPKPQALKPVKIIKTLADLTAAYNVPVKVAIIIHDQPVEMEGRRLNPREANEVKILLEAAMPPLLPAEVGADGQPGEPRFNYMDEEYRVKSAENYRLARAIGLYCSFPLFAEAARGLNLELKNREEIRDFIENQPVDDDGLRYMFGILTEKVVDLQAVANFTSGSNSPAAS